MLRILLLCVMVSMGGCIAFKKDVDLAKAECLAENSAKQKVMEERLRADIAALTDRLRKVEEKLNLEKTVQENKINLSFSTLDELKGTIRDISNRIDAIDVGANRSTADLAATVKRVAEQSDALAKEVALLKAEWEDQRPVEHVTIDKGGRVRLPEDAERAFNELAKMSTDAALAVAVRDGWATYLRKFPGRHDCEAVFFTGETYVAEKSWNLAIEQFRRIDTDHKGCPKHELSYIRVAQALLVLNKKDYARKVVLGMREIFPTTEYPKQVAELEKKLGLPSRDAKKGDKKEKQQEKKK
ncbi:MAG TPA: hypothetical protein PKH10_07775 [bacterium]|nr:hypothetical protein [bacterium]